MHGLYPSKKGKTGKKGGRELRGEWKKEGGKSEHRVLTGEDWSLHKNWDSPKKGKARVRPPYVQQQGHSETHWPNHNIPVVPYLQHCRYFLQRHSPVIPSFPWGNLTKGRLTNLPSAPQEHLSWMPKDFPSLCVQECAHILVYCVWWGCAYVCLCMFGVYFCAYVSMHVWYVCICT